MSWVTRISNVLILSLCLVVAVAAQSKANSSTSFQSQEVKFDGHDVALAGTLVVPKLEAGKRVPGVLIISASGATPRDGLGVGNSKQAIYRELAEHLVGRGIAVLRYDKRCIGASDCKVAGTFDDYIDDARKAASFLMKHPQVDPAKVFLFGHDEGGYIASSVAAQEDPKVAGVVLAAMAGRTLGKMVREHIQARMAEAGKTQAAISEFLAKYDRVLKDMMIGKTNFAEEKLDAKDPYDSVLLDMVKRREIVIGLLINDPLQIVNNIQSPTLILQGRKDVQVAVKDAQYLEESMKRSDHADVTLHLLDDVDHLLKTNKGAASWASQTENSQPLDAGLLTILTDWLLKKAK